MAGHSHWANIAVRKGKQDAKRGKLFSKLSRDIIIAARNGGGDPDMNLKLRYAIDKARAVSHAQGQHRAGHQDAAPASSKATTYDEITYEGYGPGGVAILVEVADRQPQPHQRRGPQDLREGRRQDGHPRLRRLPVRAQGPLRRRRRRSTRTRTR